MKPGNYTENNSHWGTLLMKLQSWIMLHVMSWEILSVKWSCQRYSSWYILSMDTHQPHAFWFERGKDTNVPLPGDDHAYACSSGRLHLRARNHVNDIRWSSFILCFPLRFAFTETLFSYRHDKKIVVILWAFRVNEDTSRISLLIIPTNFLINLMESDRASFLIFEPQYTYLMLLTFN